MLVDGEPRSSCLTPLAAVDGAVITTLEGLGEAGTMLAGAGGLLQPLRGAMRLLHAGDGRRGDGADRAKGGPVERDEVLEALGGHYCRCTGYVKIVDAVMAASRGEVEAVDVPADEPTRPGARHEGRRRTPPPLRRHRPRHRPDAVRRRRPRRQDALGEGASLAAPPRGDHEARHDEGRGDEGRARGDHARDVPKNVYGHLEGLGVPGDEPLLADGEVRYKGQPIAAVAAESEAAA